MTANRAITFRCTTCGHERYEQKAARRRLFCPECDEMRTFEGDKEEREAIRRRRRENRRNRGPITGGDGDE